MLTFEILLFRLREQLREKVRGGQLTERGMARATGVSQPHLHNIMKGIRTLPTELADQLLQLSGCQLQALMGTVLTEANQGDPLERQKNRQEIDTPVAQHPFATDNLPACHLSDDPLMEPRFKSGDLVYYEPQVDGRSEINARSLYLVSNEGKSLARYLRMGGKRLYLVSEASLSEPVRWDYVSLADRHILEIVRGRIVWICRKVEEAQPGSTE